MKNFYINMRGSFKFFKGDYLPYVTDPSNFRELSPCRLFSGMSAHLFSRRISTKYGCTYTLIASSKVCISAFYQVFQTVVSASEFVSAHPSTFSSAFERSLFVANSVASEICLKFPGLPAHFDVAYISYDSSSKSYYVDCYYKVVQEK